MLAVALIRPPVRTLPLVVLPLTLTSPVTYSPAVENTATLLVPPMLTLTLPPDAVTLTSLVPL